MTALLLGLVLTVAMVRVVHLMLRRADATESRGVAAESRGFATESQGVATELQSIARSPLPSSPEVAGLDDAAFREWLGVLPSSYDRYVDIGLEDLEILLADQPAGQVGEDPS